MKEDNSFILQI